MKEFNMKPWEVDELSWEEIQAYMELLKSYHENEHDAIKGVHNAWRRI